MLQDSDVNTLIRSFNTVLREVLDAYAPTFTNQATLRTKYPWFNNEVKEQRQKIHRLDHLWYNVD